LGLLSNIFANHIMRHIRSHHLPRYISSSSLRNFRFYLRNIFRAQTGLGAGVRAKKQTAMQSLSKAGLRPRKSRRIRFDIF
jgi:hypothetical protein